jgi:MinD-like ATPase involved in chromosome partitioning or flagellar assembly
MHRNGHAATLRVLLTGSEAEQLAPSIGAEPTVSLIGPVRAEANVNLSPADVVLHVVASSSAPEVSNEVASLRSRSSAPIILAAYGEPNGIVETGLAVGAADVLSLPQPPETVLFALRKAALAYGAAGGAGKILTVFSPKGGSGKTVLSTNIAVAAARSGIDTLLVDLDLQFGDTALTMGVSPRATIADLAASSGATDVEKLKAFVCAGPVASLALLAAPTRPEDAQVVNQVELKAILEAARGAYGAVVVDTGPLFDVAMLAAVDCSDQLLIVCNPEITSLKNVRIGLDTLERLGFPRSRISVVVNRVGAPGGVTQKEIEQALEVEIAYELPDDAAVPKALNRAVPVVIADEESRFARAVSALGTSLLGEAAPVAAQQRRSILRGRR